MIRELRGLASRIRAHLTRVLLSQATALAICWLACSKSASRTSNETLSALDADFSKLTVHGGRMNEMQMRAV
jgi:hypothetical protein